MPGLTMTEGQVLEKQGSNEGDINYMFTKYL